MYECLMWLRLQHPVSTVKPGEEGRCVNNRQDSSKSFEPVRGERESLWDQPDDRVHVRVEDQLPGLTFAATRKASPKSTPGRGDACHTRGARPRRVPTYTVEDALGGLANSSTAPFSLSSGRLEAAPLYPTAHMPVEAAHGTETGAELVCEMCSQLQRIMATTRGIEPLITLNCVPSKIIWQRHKLLNVLRQSLNQQYQVSCMFSHVLGMFLTCSTSSTSMFCYVLTFSCSYHAPIMFLSCSYRVSNMFLMFQSHVLIP